MWKLLILDSREVRGVITPNLPRPDICDRVREYMEQGWVVAIASHIICDYWAEEKAGDILHQGQLWKGSDGSYTITAVEPEANPDFVRYIFDREVDATGINSRIFRVGYPIRVCYWPFTKTAIHLRAILDALPNPNMGPPGDTGWLAHVSLCPDTEGQRLHAIQRTPPYDDPASYLAENTSGKGDVTSRFQASYAPFRLSDPGQIYYWQRWLWHSDTRQEKEICDRCLVVGGEDVRSAAELAHVRWMSGHSWLRQC